MLIQSNHRGITQTDWLYSAHSFSFADYYDPQKMGFAVLRVINQDTIAPGAGFGMHSHHNMEIITYVLKGALQHKDSLGNESIIKAGEIQRMSAGSGIRHSEVNASHNEACELLQIWIVPNKPGISPSYQEKCIQTPTQNHWQLLVSEQGIDHSLSIHQSLKLFRATIEANAKLDYVCHKGRCLWLQIIEGDLTADNITLSAGDGLGTDNNICLKAQVYSEVLLFDMPA
jgi:redox-sensitive bicupin YhaK (pirin superfamily)